MIGGVGWHDLRMKLATLRRRRGDVPLPGVIGPARVDRRTASLVKRLRPGDIAVLDHVDLDRASAEALVAARVAAVVNASPSISGRYPNLGPEIIAAADIPILDEVGPDVFGAIKDGSRVRLDGDTLHAGDHVVAKGVPQNAETVAARLLDAKAGMSTQLEAFAATTIEFMKRERALLLDGAGIPEISTPLAGRHVLVVVRGYDHAEDLAALRHYIREYKPVLVGVDGGADALLEAGHRPDLIVGNPELIGNDALRSGAELVVHAPPDGEPEGLERVQDLGIHPVLFASGGTSEDAALLLADERGAALIVAAGTKATLLEFLDEGAAMASAVLARLRLGGKLVDATAVTRLHRPRISAGTLWLLVAAAVVAAVTVLAVSSAGRPYLADVTGWWSALVSWFRGLFQ
jgi:uncharacterized membrane-anchored protein